MPKVKRVKYRGPERRKYLRIPTRTVVRYVMLSNKLRPLANRIRKSFMKDICAAGIKFSMRKKMPVHTIIEFRFKLPGIRMSIDGLGEIVRIKAKSVKKSYNAGVRFVWIQQRNVKLIDNYVRKKMIRRIVRKLRKKKKK